MNWKQKAIIQRIVAKLPSGLSYKIYYFLQRKMGSWRTINPTKRLLAGIDLVNHIHKQKQDVNSKTFLEIGTGWGINLPITLWLCGAAKIITVDLNPYLKKEIVFRSILYIKEHKKEIIDIFGEHSKNTVFQERFDALINCKLDMESILDMMNIQYLAPANAICLDLPSEIIDYHISYTVFEHIPREIVEEIIQEGKRLLRKDGMFIHLIDFSDHCSHSDSSISSINFLQFTEKEWQYYSGNRYAYHNRLRIDDFTDIFIKGGLEILELDKEIDQKALTVLRNKFPLNEKFKNKDAEINATVSALIVARID